MSGIFGIYNLDGAPVAPGTLKTMQTAMQHWGPDGGGAWRDGPVGLGQMLLISTPEAEREKFPREVGGGALTAAGRVDNRRELIATCEAPSNATDGDLIAAAWLKWGKNAPEHILGDWSFAAWNPRLRELFLARDHFGNTSLFYYAGPRVFAFASDKKALLALHLAPLELDELYLAQLLVSWTAYHGERVIQKPLKRLPPAHCLTVSPQKLETRLYWDMTRVSLQKSKKLEDYVEPFREIFDEAVRCRLRTPENTSVSTQLSGGLDSGSVSATAGLLLRAAGQGLESYTSVLQHEAASNFKTRFVDEWPLAELVARTAGNIKHTPVHAENNTPLAAIRKVLDIQTEPGHAAGNFYWMDALEQTAHLAGHRVLLTGQLGNAGFSWNGDISSQPWPAQISKLGWKSFIRALLVGLLPTAWLSQRRLWQIPADWHQNSAIHPDFARRIRVMEQRLADPSEIRQGKALDQRFLIFKPAQSFVGALHAQNGAAHQLEIRDPTGDVRLITYSLSIPDEVFLDPRSWEDRRLVRAAMLGRLPDEVRLNQKRGLQAGDLVNRLRASAPEVETALAELSRGPAAQYLDVPYMRQVWESIQAEDSRDTYLKAVTILTRGIMAGWFVNEF